MQRILAVFILAATLLSLFGCIAAAFVVGATAGGAVVYDKRGVPAMLNDNGIVKKVTYKINHDPAFAQGSRIKVAVFNRVVLLAGQVPSPDLSQQAYQVAMSVENVKRVYNQLAISAPISLTQQANDAWITSEVKSRMLATRGLHSTQIKVITEDDVVYLMGIVTHKQAQLAADTASDIKGVIKVVKVFEYEE